MAQPNNLTINNSANSIVYFSRFDQRNVVLPHGTVKRRRNFIFAVRFRHFTDVWICVTDAVSATHFGVVTDLYRLHYDTERGKGNHKESRRNADGDHQFPPCFLQIVACYGHKRTVLQESEAMLI